MSDLLSIGAGGVRAYQSALGTVSENIANAGTAGYARRAADLKEVVAPGGGLQAGRVTSGMGVVVAGVSRRADDYAATSVRTATSDLAKTEGGVRWLDRIEGALTGDQLGARVTGFFASARTLAADPGSIAARSAMLEAGTAAAGAFRGTGAALARASADLDASAGEAVDKLNALASGLAEVNGRIGRSAPGSAAAAGLADERDRLLEEMSALSDIGVGVDAAGRATVRLGGANGPVLVAGQEAGGVTFARSETGVATFQLYRAGEAGAFQPNGGALGAIADAATRVLDARTRVDAFANSFAERVNEVQAQGRDLDGAPGAAMFSTGDGAAGLTLSLADPRGIAAAGAAGGARDASNLAALEAARTAGGFEAGLTGITAGNAAALQQRRVVAEAQGAIRDNAAAARDAVSGVDLDTEAVDLIRFQQAYQASSRVIQVARETFQSILGIN